MFDFPVWVFVNLTDREANYLVLQGGEGTDIPTTLAVFSNKGVAQKVAKQRGTGVITKEMNRDDLLGILKNVDGIAQVVLDMGTPNATTFTPRDVIFEAERNQSKP
jgi:hypothetical protein